MRLNDLQDYYDLYNDADRGLCKISQIEALEDERSNAKEYLDEIIEQLDGTKELDEQLFFNAIEELKSYFKEVL